MSVLNEHRRERLELLDNFLCNTKKKMASIVSTLGWSIDSISKDVEKMVACPFNPLHHIPEKSLVKHLEDCQWKAEGYGEKDLPLSVPSLAPESSLSIKFDEQLQDHVIQCAKQQNPTMIAELYHCYTVSGLDKILNYDEIFMNFEMLDHLRAGERLIPRTSDRLVADFTRDERLAMYEYVIANTAQPDIGEDITDMNKPKSSGNGKTSSYLELLAQERNLKRRRAKYRGVHTNKKSQVEILREVINQQMEMLSEYIAEKNDGDLNATDDFSRVCETKMRNSEYPMRRDRSAEDRSASRSAHTNGGQYQVRSSTRSDDFGGHRGASNDRGYDKGSNVSRDSYEKKEQRKRSKDCSGRDASSGWTSNGRSHKSSHKSHRHRSQDRHEERRKRRRSRDAEKSRSSGDSKHDERHSESSKYSSREDRKSRKRRRSRD